MNIGELVRVVEYEPIEYVYEPVEIVEIEVEEVVNERDLEPANS